MSQDRPKMRPLVPLEALLGVSWAFWGILWLSCFLGALTSFRLVLGILWLSFVASMLQVAVFKETNY